MNMTAWTFTGGRVFIRLRGRFTALYDRMQLKARHATKSRGMQLKVDMQCDIGEENQQRARYMSIFPLEFFFLLSLLLSGIRENKGSLILISNFLTGLLNLS